MANAIREQFDGTVRSVDSAYRSLTQSGGADVFRYYNPELEISKFSKTTVQANVPLTAGRAIIRIPVTSPVITDSLNVAFEFRNASYNETDEGYGGRMSNHLRWRGAGRDYAPQSMNRLIETEDIPQPAASTLPTPIDQTKVREFSRALGYLIGCIDPAKMTNGANVAHFGPPYLRGFKTVEIRGLTPVDRAADTYTIAGGGAANVDVLAIDPGAIQEDMLEDGNEPTPGPGIRSLFKGGLAGHGEALEVARDVYGFLSGAGGNIGLDITNSVALGGVAGFRELAPYNCVVTKPEELIERIIV